MDEPAVELDHRYRTIVRNVVSMLRSRGFAPLGPAFWETEDAWRAKFEDLFQPLSDA